MGALNNNPHWHGMVRRLPWGLWLVGPRSRSVITAALEDAAAYRRYGMLDDPGGCNGCPTPRDIADCETLGVDPPGPCEDHQLDRDAAAAYRELLDRIGVTSAELALLRQAMAAAEERPS